MISSLRAFGYHLPMAIADLIDNSIYARAKTIAIDYDWNDGDPWFRIVDDGEGMTEDQLREAMRPGSQGPLEERDREDLGRFGLGLKTASFSQGRLLTVQTRTGPGPAHTRSWDLDHVCATGRWELATAPPPGTPPLLSVLDGRDRGTVVLVQKLDRLGRPGSADAEAAQGAFLEGFGQVARYLEMVFHRYLEGRAPLRISVGRHLCRPWDPFLLSNKHTQELPTERLDKRRVVVTPFVLAHVSHRTGEENREGAGLYGWNAHQGFYIYRNRRMIIPGGYLDLRFKAEEHYKLCRIRVDLPNDLDHLWGIDVRKAAASPPSHVRGDLERIAKATREQAVEVYRARTGKARKARGPGARQNLWTRKSSGGKVTYQINRDNEAIERVLAEQNPPASWVRKLFHLIENSVPHRLIILDNAEDEDCHVALPPAVSPPPAELIELCRTFYRERLALGRAPQEAAAFACSFFDDHPAYRAALDQLIEATP